MVQPDRPQITIRCMRFASWIAKATDTHREYVIFMAHPRQQGLWERASILHSYVLYLSCLLLDPTLRLLNVSWHVNLFTPLVMQNPNTVKVLKQAGDISIQIVLKHTHTRDPVLQPRVRNNRDTTVKPSDWSTQCTWVLLDGDILWSFVSVSINLLRRLPSIVFGYLLGLHVCLITYCFVFPCAPRAKTKSGSDKSSVTKRKTIDLETKLTNIDGGKTASAIASNIGLYLSTIYNIWKTE